MEPDERLERIIELLEQSMQHSDREKASLHAQLAAVEEKMTAEIKQVVNNQATAVRIAREVRDQHATTRTKAEAVYKFCFEENGESAAAQLKALRKQRGLWEQIKVGVVVGVVIILATATWEWLRPKFDPEAFKKVVIEEVKAATQQKSVEAAPAPPPEPSKPASRPPARSRRSVQNANRQPGRTSKKLDYADNGLSKLKVMRN